MAKTFTLTDGERSVNLIDPAGMMPEYGGLGGTRFRPEFDFTASPLSDGAALRRVTHPNVSETYRLNVQGSSHDNAAHQWRQLLDLLTRARQYHTTGWQGKPVYLIAQATGETFPRYARVFGAPEMSLPDLYAPVFDATNIVRDVTVTIVREPYWRSTPPGSLPDGVCLSHPDHPMGTARTQLVPNYRDAYGITHVYSYDASLTAFSSNLVSTYPFSYFVVSGSTPAADDIVYFGSTAGPVHNFVLHLGTLLVATGYTYIWEYWNGAAWTDARGALSNRFDDYSYGLQGTDGRENWKLYPVLFDGASNWATTAINSVTAYWLRLRITAVTTWTQTPVQSDQAVYVANDPYVEIPAAAIDGDAEALVRLVLKSVGDIDEATAYPIQINRVIVGAKSRGLGNFISHINLGDAGNPTGWATTYGTDTAAAADPTAPGGQRGACTFATDQTLVGRARVYLGSTAGTTNVAADDFRGTYRAFLRCKQSGGSAGAVSVALAISWNEASSTTWDYRTSAIALQAVDQYVEVVDFGLITLPPAPVAPDEVGQIVVFNLFASATGATPDLYLYDLVLIPVDEWAVAANDPVLNSGGYRSALWHFGLAAPGNDRARDLAIDGGLLYPHAKAVLLRGMKGNAATASFKMSAGAEWELRGGEIKLAPAKTTRLYFFFERWKENAENTLPLYAHLRLAAAVELYAHERWQALRGQGRYLLLDRFDRPVPAGSLNGTACVPGPGTRTVTDTNSKLSIDTYGRASFATGGVGAGDPGLWLDVRTRAVGQMVLATVVPSAGGFNVGWDTNQAGDVQDGIRSSGVTTLQVHVAGTAVTVGSITGGVPYRVACLMRAAGHAFFARGGTEFPHWRLLRLGATGADSRYPGAVVTTGTSVFVAAELLVPFTRWLPAPLVSDGFGTAGYTSDGLGHAEGVAGGLGAGGAGQAWTAVTGTWVNTGGVAQATALGSADAIALHDLGTPHVYLLLDVTRSGGNAGLILRYQDARNHVLVYHDGTNVKIDKVVAGVTTNVATTAATYSAGAVLEITADGTSFRAFYNGTATGSVTISDSDLQGSTRAGRYTTNTGNTFDDFSAYALGNEGQYDLLEGIA